MKTLAALTIVAALSGCAGHTHDVTSDQPEVTSSSVGKRVLYGLSTGLATFGQALGKIHAPQTAPSLQPQRCHVSGQWVTCYPY